MGLFDSVSQGWDQLGALTTDGLRMAGMLPPAPQAAPQNTFQAGGFDFGQTLRDAQAAQAGARGGQDALIQALLARSQGQGVSPAELQLREAAERNQAMIAGALAAQRGVNPALAARQIAMGGAQQQQATNQQAAILRAQEQNAAQALLGQTLGQQRGQDSQMFGLGSGGLASQNALNAGVASGNQQAEIQQRRIQAEQERAASENRNALAGSTASGAAGAIPIVAGLAGGGVVPGAAPMPGDHPANDTQPIMASPGEIVVPRSVVQSGDPGLIQRYIAAILAQMGGGHPAGGVGGAAPMMAPSPAASR